jgi:hypothetical protein
MRVDQGDTFRSRMYKDALVSKDLQAHYKIVPLPIVAEILTNLKDKVHYRIQIARDLVEVVSLEMDDVDDPFKWYV